MSAGVDLFGPKIIKSISFDEKEIIHSIGRLHSPDWFDLDPCYSVGAIYERCGIPKPSNKFDINPSVADVLQSSAENLPIESNTIKSIFFDPPFLAGLDANGKATGKILNRFSGFKSMKELINWYAQCLQEFERLLVKGGILVFKCQDTVSSQKQWFSHCHIYNMAKDWGFYPLDLFILLAKQRMIGGNHQRQFHARKFHCYYWVFRK